MKKNAADRLIATRRAEGWTVIRLDRTRADYLVTFRCDGRLP